MSRLRAVVLALAAASVHACSSRPSSPPDIVLVTADALRADHLSFFGYARATSPAIDAVARSATVFSDAVTVVPKTGPSFSALFSGLYPHELTVEANRFAIPEDVPLLAERLHDRGYRTAAFVSNPVLAPEKGYARGFETYRLVEDVDASNDAFFEWARTTWRSPAFVWIHYIDPHGPYAPPERLEGLFANDALARAEPRRLPLGYSPMPGYPDAYVLGAVPRYQRIGDEDRVAEYVRRYDAEIRGVDDAFAAVVDFLKDRHLYEASTIVFSSDHGESLGEDDYWFEHGWFASEATLRIPFFVKRPRQTEGRTVAEQVSNLDLAPTLLALAGAEPLPRSRGADLFAPSPGARSLLVANAFSYPTRYFGLRFDGWKYVRKAPANASPTTDPEHEALYHLAGVSAETRDVAGTEPKRLREMRDGFAEVLREAPPPAGRTPHAVERHEPSEVERLKSLGYVN